MILGIILLTVTFVIGVLALPCSHYAMQNGLAKKYIEEDEDEDDD